MNKTSIFKTSETDWERLNAMQDEDIDTSEIPEVTADQIAQATLRVGGQPVSTGKVRVSMYLDAEVVEYFKAQAGDRGYQALINETLRASMHNNDLEETIRRVIREELGVEE